MKLACSSTAFDEQLRSGDLTQLEWIDACARELAVDGAVFDVRHFPRTDTDYLAQIKKMATDLGLSVAALRHDGFLSIDREHMEQSFEMAQALGAPLLAAPLPLATAMSWTEALAALGMGTSLAKRFNITLALRNVPNTFAAGVHDMKRVTKEADSAWLRYGPDFQSLEAGSDIEGILPRTVLVCHELDRSGDADLAALSGLLKSFRGFVVLDSADGSATAAGTRTVVDRIWRLSHVV